MTHEGKSLNSGQTTPTRQYPRASRRRERNRVLMLDIAEQKFSARGLHAVRVEEIADAAEVSVGTVYTHFGNKDELYLAVAHRALEELAQRVTAWQTHSGSELERIVAVGEVCMAELQTRPFLCQFLLADATEPSDTATRHSITEYLERIYRSVGETIAGAIDAGEAKPVDTYLFARYLVGSWAGVLTAAQRSGAPLSAASANLCLNQAIAVLRDGLSTTTNHSV